MTVRESVISLSPVGAGRRAFPTSWWDLGGEPCAILEAHSARGRSERARSEH